MCSTPFGIIGILTSGTEITHQEHEVLNAFRHHRNSHGVALSVLIVSDIRTIVSDIFSHSYCKFGRQEVKAWEVERDKSSFFC